MAVSPTFLSAPRPNRIPSRVGRKSSSLWLTDGGRIRMPICLHSEMYFTTFLVSFFSLVSSAAMNSFG